MVKKNAKLVQVEIPSTLAEKLKNKADKEGYKNLSEYVAHLLRRECSPEKDDSSLNPEEEERIKERLKDLGYIE